MAGVVQQSVTGVADRDERALDFPPARRQKGRKKESGIRNAKAADNESNKETGISVPQTKSGEWEPEKEAAAVREPSGELQGNEDGEDPLMNFLNVGIYEGR